ncbi:glycerophosphodiester phosphodiesterase family protein [Leucobacter chironomi]|uniref:glycerophosphodiester phosphodiesterase family protein n=1 Tax=Leucobacter chironomi TaxID=491918 RepID=UPI000402003D|nr:glycerophosphodiester phosphodiesterase family protein [Leucobacter chironomi]
MHIETVSKPGIWRESATLFTRGWGLVRAGGARLLGLILISQLVILGAAMPVIGWLFREALRASGMTGLDLGALSPGRGLTLTLGLIVAIVALAFWLISLQFTALVVLLQWPGIGWHGLARELGRVARKLLRPGSLSLLFYLFLLLPLTGFGFTSAFTRGIAIPSFVSGELLKSVSSGVALGVVLLILAVLNVRLALTVPIFVLTTGGRASRSSWRLTRGVRAWLPLVLAVAAAMLLGGAAVIALTIAAVVPTALADELAPAASPVVAAYSLGIAQVLGILLSGLVTAFVASILIARVQRGADRLAPGVELVRLPGSAAPATRSGRRAARSKRPALLVGALSLVVALGLGTAAMDTMQRLSQAPETLVLAHRGFSDGGVENTIGGLEAAHAAGADLVEMDVMQTKDGEFVAMHDATLARLADRPDAVKDLTLAELTAITVHDLQGHEDVIPSFSDYVVRAQQLGMPLLIEIKLGGADTPDHVERLVAELERLDALESNIYHSLDAPSVARLKQLRPDLSVGYTMAFAAVAAPDTPADFIVVEEWSATEPLQQSTWAAGLGFMVWTVNDEPGMREQLRRSVDGIVSDHPDRVLALRSEMQEETGLVEVLVDTVTRFVRI